MTSYDYYRHTGRQGWLLVWLAERPSCSCHRCAGEWGQLLVPLAGRPSASVAVALVAKCPPLPGTEVALEGCRSWLGLPAGCGKAEVPLGEHWCQLRLPARCGRLGAALEGCLLG